MDPVYYMYTIDNDYPYYLSNNPFVMYSIELNQKTKEEGGETTDRGISVSELHSPFLHFSRPLHILDFLRIPIQFPHFIVRFLDIGQCGL